MAVYPQPTTLDSGPRILEQPAPGITFNSGYVSKEENTLTIRCQVPNLRDAKVSDAGGTLLFAMQGAALWKSWSVRRSLKSASGEHVFDLRHYETKVRSWIVEDAYAKALARIKDETPFGANSSTFDAYIAADSGEASVCMRSVDREGTKTVFEAEGITFAELLREENNDLPFLKTRGILRSVWKVRIAANVDLAMVLALAMCRIQVSHQWRR